MTVKEFMDKFGTDSEAKELIDNVSLFSFEKLEAKLKEKYPQLSKEDISELFDDISDDELDLDDLSGVAGGVVWKQNLPDPNKPT